MHADLDTTDEPLGRRLRRLRGLRHNYAVVIGDTEVADRVIRPKERGSDSAGAAVTVDELIETIKAAERAVLGPA